MSRFEDRYGAGDAGETVAWLTPDNIYTNPLQPSDAPANAPVVTDITSDYGIDAAVDIAAPTELV